MDNDDFWFSGEGFHYTQVSNKLLCVPASVFVFIQ